MNDGAWQPATYNGNYYVASWETTTVGDGEATLNARAIDSANNVSNDSNTVTVSNGGGGDTMHVSAIDMWYGTAGRNYIVYTRVTVVDETGNAVQGATVSLKITLPTGSTATGTGTTTTDGTVTFDVKSKSTGTYTSEVTDVTHATLTYEPATNIETSEALAVP